MRQYIPGDQIGGEFTVLDVFGGGGSSGMGVVYLVENREVPFPFVLKTFQQIDDPESRRQFEAEAHAWVNAGVNAHIVQAYWVRKIAGQMYVAAEFIEPDEVGRNNLTHFLEGGRLLPEMILLWSAQFCHGMDYAKARGVLAHRDIKPDNLMIAKDGSLKVTDFGIAKSISLDAVVDKKRWRVFSRKNNPESISKTKTGLAFGTLPYMAPEQFQDAKSVDHRADIYSFGVILYEMVTGRDYPYRVHLDSANIGLEYREAHVSQDPIVIDSPLMPIIEECLQKKPGKRYASYDALLSDLHKVAKKLDLKIPLIRHVSKDDEELYAQAQSYVALGDKDRALKSINEYVEKYPENFCGWTEKGRLHHERGELAEALDATKRSLAENPYNSHAWNNLGIILFHTNAPFREVRAAYENALRLDSANTAAMMNFVGPLVQNGNIAEAARLTSAALQIAPKKPLLVAKATELLTELVKIRDLESGIMMLESWTKARPDDVDAWHNLGLFYMDADDPEAAVSCFQNVRKLAPEDDFAVIQLTKLYFSLKKGRECLECCNELLCRGAEPLLAVSTKARVINFMGGYQQAIAFLKPYMDHNRRNDLLWVVMAEIHEFRDNYGAAANSLREAKRILQFVDGPEVAANLEYVETKLREMSEKATK